MPKDCEIEDFFAYISVIENLSALATAQATQSSELLGRALKFIDARLNALEYRVSELEVDVKTLRLILGGKNVCTL